MYILNFSDFEKKKIDFINANGGLEKVITSDLQDNTYYKDYICNNGKILHEINRKVYKRAKAKIYGLDFYVDVSLFESEQFNDVDSTSYFHYEKYDK